jgi:cell division protein FtsW (lipid II flippase)
LAGGLRVPDLLVQLRRYKYVWLTSGLLLTALTFLFGTYPGGFGPRLWLGCCGVYLQPSEPLKLLLIIYLAAYLADRLPVSFNLAQLLTPTLILVGAALALLVRQRDLGTASLFILIYTVVVYLASRRKRVLLISAAVVLAAGAAGYLLFDVVRIRVDAWLNPWLDPGGRSYQIVQSLLAVASGGVLGSGPGLGSPGAVPVAFSDFIFSSIAEETGLLGAVGLLLLYALLIERGFQAALYAANNYRRYLAGGITAYLAMQAIFIIGGNLRLLPLTGVTLPFVSYGGSSLLTSYLAILLLLVISNRGDEEVAPLVKPDAILLVSGGLMAGLLALALAAGWWAVARSPALVARPDNPRRAIADRFVIRGALLDRSGSAISHTEGQPGSYQRVYDYPNLSDTAGYNSPGYGLAGLEAGLDPYLRGVAEDGMTVWLNQQLYGQPPPGENVRLTIDLKLQQQADTLLSGHRGALVLLNAKTGEILAIASHPNFDPNRLEQDWSTLVSNPGSPLLNRATQGLYPPGASLGPFLYSFAVKQDHLPQIPDQLAYTSENGTYPCATPPALPYTPAKLISSGCPAPLVTLSQSAGAAGLTELFTSLGLYEVPDLPLPTNGVATSSITRTDLAAIGQGGLLVTPLQMARAAAVLSNNGVLPPLSIANAVLDPAQGWKLLPTGQGRSTVLEGSTNAAMEQLILEGDLSWHTVALAHTSEQSLTWYLAGSLPNAQGTPLAMALVLEEDNPQLAQEIGQKVMEAGR